MINYVHAHLRLNIPLNFQVLFLDSLLKSPILSVKYLNVAADYHNKVVVLLLVLEDFLWGI